MNNNSDSKFIENPKHSGAGGVNVGEVSHATGVIIGENIKTGDISINVTYKTAQNYGLTLLPPTYFKDNQQTDQNFNSWKRGFPIELPSVMKGLHFPRTRVLGHIKDKLDNIENNHRLLLLGRPGSSKSTILKEIICDYFKNKYQIMYNWGNTKIENSEEVVNFIGQLLDNGNKILIALDNIHLGNTVSIFPIIRGLSSHNKRKNLRILLTARIPDYGRFLDERLSKLTPDIRSSLRDIDDEKKFRFLLPDFTEDEIKEFIKQYQNEQEVKNFINTRSSSKIMNEQTYQELARLVSDQTKGDPIKIKFMVFGRGLAQDAQMSYDDYVQNSENKIKATLFCSFLNILNDVASKKRLEENNLLESAQELAQEYVLELSDAGYHTKHPSWDLELFSYILDVTMTGTLQSRKEYLKSVLNLLFKNEDITFTRSLISAVFDITTIDTEVGKKIPIEVIDDVVIIPRYLDNKSMFDLYCYDIARCYYQLGKYQKALYYAGKALKFDTQNADGWNNKGVTLDSQDEYAEAIKSYDKAIKINPQYADAWINRGESLRKQKKYNDAIKSYDKAIELDPQNALAWYNKGIALANQQRHDEAATYFDKAIEITPQDADAWIGKGLALDNQGKLDDAIKSYDKAIDINPQNPDAWNNRGESLRMQKKYNDAIKSYEKAMEVDPQYAGAWYNKGLALADEQKYDEAAKYFDKATEISPQYADAWYNKGLALDIQGKFDEAIKSYDKATEINPLAADAWTNKGLALDNLERYEDAIAAYDKALELDTTDADVWYNKARCLVKENRINDALNNLAKAISLGGEEYAEAATEENVFQAIRNNKKFIELVNSSQFH